MKTPERWRPSRVVPSLSLFLPERPSSTHCDVTWPCHVTLQQCDMTYYVITKWTVHSFPPFICLENHVFDLVTLTYDLEYQTLPRYCPDTPLHQFSCPYVKQFGCESVHRQTDRRTDRQMDRRRGPKTLPRPSTREVIKLCEISTYFRLLEGGRWNSFM